MSREENQHNKGNVTSILHKALNDLKNVDKANLTLCLYIYVYPIHIYVYTENHIYCMYMFVCERD